MIAKSNKSNLIIVWSLKSDQIRDYSNPMKGNDFLVLCDRCMLTVGGYL